jgi:hypothetical protein
MSTIATLVVQLVGDTSGYYKSLEDARQTSESMSTGIVSGLSTVGGAIVTGAFAIAAAAAVGLGIELKNDVQDAMDLEDAHMRLNAILQNTGSVTGVTVGMVDQLADKYSHLTRFSDDQIVSAGGVLATYKNINSDAFPQTMQLAMDLATRMGTDLPTAAQTLGKALADPGQGLLRLNAAGLEFNTAQAKQIRDMAASGDMAGAQAKMMDALSGAIGGLADAAGDTTAGKWAIFNNTLLSARETVGSALLPTLSTLATMLTTQLMKPEVQAFIAQLAVKIQELGSQVLVWLPQIVTWFKTAFGWLMQNQGVIVGVLAAIGVAVAAFGVTVATAAWAAMAPLLPVIAIMIAVGAIAYVVYEAWTNNWGGIRDKVQEVIGAIVDFWNTKFLPAIQALISWWQNDLLPALQMVWNFIQNDLLPLFDALASFIDAVFSLAVRVLAGLWQNILLPALQAVSGWIGDKLHPVFKLLSDFINNSVMPVVIALGNWLVDHLQPAFEGISDAIQGVISFIHNLTTAINNIKLPKWLTPGSPTPFEIGLLGIQAALHQVANSGLAEFTAALNITGPSMIPATNGALAGQITPGANYGGNNFYITGSNAMDIANQVTDKLKLQGGLKYK